jgi:hypothetical protein
MLLVPSFAAAASVQMVQLSTLRKQWCIFFALINWTTPTNYCI